MLSGRQAMIALKGCDKERCGERNMPEIELVCRHPSREQDFDFAFASLVGIGQDAGSIRALSKT